MVDFRQNLTDDESRQPSHITLRVKMAAGRNGAGQNGGKSKWAGHNDERSKWWKVEMAAGG